MSYYKYLVVFETFSEGSVTVLCDTLEEAQAIYEEHKSADIVDLTEAPIIQSK
jgi:hypothetical protein